LLHLLAIIEGKKRALRFAPLILKKKIQNISSLNFSPSFFFFVSEGDEKN